MKFQTILVLLILSALAGTGVYYIFNEEGDAIGEVIAEEPQQGEEDGVEREIQAREEEVRETEIERMTADVVYQNGTYTSNITYRLPNGGSHDMEVILTLEEDTVTEMTIHYDGDRSGGSTPNQERFNQAAAPLVVGQKVDTIALSRVGGSSLTTGGFNDALEEIKGQARS